MRKLVLITAALAAAAVGIATAGPAVADCLDVPATVCYDDERPSGGFTELYYLVDVGVLLPNDIPLQASVYEYTQNGDRGWWATANYYVGAGQSEYGDNHPFAGSRDTIVMTPVANVMQRANDDGTCALRVYGPADVVQEFDCAGAAVPYTPPPRLP